MGTRPGLRSRRTGPRPRPDVVASVTYWPPRDPAALTALATLIQRAIVGPSTCLLWPTEHQVVPHVQDYFLYHALRQTHGEARSPHEAPGHLAHASEVNEIVLTLRTALRGEWDLLILPAGEARARVARLLQPYTDVQFGRASRQVYDSLAGLAVPDLALELAPEIEALADAVKRAGLAVTPNIVFFRNIGWMTTDSIHTLLRAPELAYAAPAQRLNWSPMLNNYRNGFRSTQAVMSPYLLAVTRLEEAITAAFYRKGVPIMAGTDSEFLSAQPGYGLHTELGIFVGLGMTPLDALKAATITSARVMGIADSVGTIEVGRVADLVLLYADPLADIGNTRQVAGVFTAGRYISRERLQVKLDSLRRSYAPVQRSLATFMDALERRGAAAAITTYRDSPHRATIAKPVERVINSYGYRLLGEKKVQEAIDVFKLNTETFPHEYNTWDSLAEAYMTAGENDLAIRYYHKVLEMNPGDGNATEMLRRLGEK